jgi:hypothetical protein
MVFPNRLLYFDRNFLLMAAYRVLYWHEFPAQVKATDGTTEANVALAPSFTERIDRAAMKRGMWGTDEYLEGWQWSEPQNRDGTAQEVAEAVKLELEASL